MCYSESLNSHTSPTEPFAIMIKTTVPHYTVYSGTSKCGHLSLDQAKEVSTFQGFLKMWTLGEIA